MLIIPSKLGNHIKSDYFKRQYESQSVGDFYKIGVAGKLKN